MRMMLPFAVLITLYVIVEVVFILGIKSISKKKFFKVVLYINLIASVLIIIAFSILYYYIKKESDFLNYTNLFYILTYFLLLFVTKLVFVTFYFLNFLLIIICKLLKIKQKLKIFTKTGLVLCCTVFILMLYGILFEKTNYKIRNEKIAFNNLPASFNNFKIVQISDIHIGSFYYNKEKLIEAVNLINECNPDVVLFTGDLVNNFSEEANCFDTILCKINAKYGKYAVLGNHDFGDYSIWRTIETKQTNLKNVIQHYKTMGFKLLRNESDNLLINNDSICIVGVDNWGLPPFKKYGNLQKALSKVNKSKFSILLSHDPTHWNQEAKYYQNINLTLSGHTHGMQFGFEHFGIKWSPIKYKYKNWAGLYKYKNNYLYINRGLGCIGFLGRVGMPPEITVIELIRK